MRSELIVKRCRPVVLALCALVFAAAASAQETTTFEPRVGQPGKDVVWVTPCGVPVRRTSPG